VESPSCKWPWLHINLCMLRAPAFRSRRLSLKATTFTSFMLQHLRI